MVQDSKAKSGTNYQQMVWQVARQIPKGKVATYGMIARSVGIDPRMAGWALHANRSGDVPCHRVVDRNGRLAQNFAFDGWREQKRRLLAEGVIFRDEMHVNLEESLWQA